jgi:hypothetical protein
MSDNFVGAAGELQPNDLTYKYHIEFDTRVRHQHSVRLPLVHQACFAIVLSH